MSNAVNEAQTADNSCSITVPRTHKPNQAKRNARGLERLVYGEGQGAWPPELFDLGGEACHALNLLDQPGIDKVIPMVRDCAAILKRFTDAHAAFIASKGA